MGLATFFKDADPPKMARLSFPLKHATQMATLPRIKMEPDVWGVLQKQLAFRREGETHKNMATALASDHCGKWNPLL